MMLQPNNQISNLIGQSDNYMLALANVKSVELIEHNNNNPYLKYFGYSMESVSERFCDSSKCQKLTNVL